VGYAVGLNLYEYVYGNPTAFSDPTGLLTAGDWRKIKKCKNFYDRYKKAQKKAEANAATGGKKYCDALAEEIRFRREYYNMNCDYYLSLTTGPGDWKSAKKGHLKQLRQKEKAYKNKCAGKCIR